ncbi:hypothetical protein RSO01_91350 [Reyranella soli]|uniref:Uncharacterized protein n=1 Tax=Reyranella soli TaxID=1230389 RepID=A0A512NSP8_9HYPH|nr:hypothetical protein RSO01_91350 [Reyranella soli]
MIDARAPVPAEQAIDGGRVALGILALVEPIVFHTALRGRIGHREPGLRAAHRAREALNPGVDVAQIVRPEL